MKLTIKEIALYPLLGALMFASKLVMESLPNIHLLAMFIITFTVVFRKKAIIPIFIFIFLTGLFNGFGIWWFPYLYLWPLLWGVTLLLPRNMPDKIAMPVYMITAGLHGLLYGTLYAPFQALAFGLSFKGTIAWIISGLPFDAIHGLSNFCMAALVLPLSKILKKSFG